MFIGNEIIVISEECRWNKKIMYIILIIMSFLMSLFYSVFMVLLISVEWLYIGIICMLFGNLFVKVVSFCFIWVIVVWVFLL